MSANLLSKMDIDVLMQMAVLGPMGASTWVPLTSDPNRMGAILWTINFDHAGDPALDEHPGEYVYRPLPIQVTAAEGLQQIAYFYYQSGDPREHELGRACADLLDRLTQLLPSFLSEVRSAPWGWRAPDISARADRDSTDDHNRSEPLPDPRVADFLSAWAATGIPIRIGANHGSDLGLEDPRSCIGTWNMEIEFVAFSPTSVILLESHDAARAAFATLVMRVQRGIGIGWNYTAVRFGNVVVMTQFSNSRQPGWETSSAQMLLQQLAEQEAQVERALQRLGEADERWSNQDPPLRTVKAEILATNVQVTGRLKSSDQRGYVANTPKKLAFLAKMIRDPALIAEIEATNTRTHTLTLLCRVPFIGKVGTARIIQVLEIDHQSRPGLSHALELETEDAAGTSATLIRSDRLSRTPSQVKIIDAEYEANLYTEDAKSV